MAFMVIEGTDGSGKGTQAILLARRLENEGYSPTIFDFPRYDTPTGQKVAEYLKGDTSKVDAKTASRLYADDRAAARGEMLQALAEGKVLVANRYLSSNLGHQGQKIEDPEERLRFFEWARCLEFEENDIPRPDINLFLHVPAEIAFELVGHKDERGYLQGAKRDGHEGDIEHFRRAEKVYLQLLEVFPTEYRLIECVFGGRLLSPEEIHAKIWAAVQNLLPQRALP